MIIVHSSSQNVQTWTLCAFFLFLFCSQCEKAWLLSYCQSWSCTVLLLYVVYQPVSDVVCIPAIKRLPVRIESRLLSAKPTLLVLISCFLFCLGFFIFSLFHVFFFFEVVLLLWWVMTIALCQISMRCLGLCACIIKLCLQLQLWLSPWEVFNANELEMRVG